MLKFNLAGSVEEEFFKIAEEKGFSKSLNYSNMAKQKIISVQQFLNKFLKDPGKVLETDGIWGPNTKEAYAAFIAKNPESGFDKSFIHMAPDNQQLSEIIKGLVHLMQRGRADETMKSVRDAFKGPQEAPSDMIFTEKKIHGTGEGPDMEFTESEVQSQKPKQIIPDNPYMAEDGVASGANYKNIMFDETVRYLVGKGYSPELANQEAERKLGKRASVKKAENAPSTKKDPAISRLYNQQYGKKPQEEFKSSNIGDSFRKIKDNRAIGDGDLETPQVTESAPTQSPVQPPGQPAIPKRQIPIKAKKPLQKNVLVENTQLKINQLSRMYNLGINLKEDGLWGPRTRAYWNYIMKEVLKTPGFVSKGNVPRPEVLASFIKRVDNLVGQKNNDGAAGEKNTEAMELASQGVPVEEALKEVASRTINELVSLANELDAAGEVKVAIAIDNQAHLYKQAMDKLYDVTGETGEQFINSAHTDHVTVAPAKDEGGKVENLVEQQKKMLDIVSKEPTGKYAEVILNLIATAESLEDQGLYKAAAKVDKAIEELQKKFPFADKKLGVEATSFFGKKNASGEQLSVPFRRGNFETAKELYERLIGFSTSIKRHIGTILPEEKKPEIKERRKIVVANLKPFGKKSEELGRKIQTKGFLDFDSLNLIEMFIDEYRAWFNEGENANILFMSLPPHANFGHTLGSVNAMGKIISDFKTKYFKELNVLEKIPADKRSFVLGGGAVDSSQEVKPSSGSVGPQGDSGNEGLSAVQRGYKKTIEGFLYNLKKTMDLLEKNAEQIGKETGQGEIPFLRLVDSLDKEYNRISSSLNDPQKYEETYNYIKDLGSTFFNLSRGLSNKFSKLSSRGIIKTSALSPEDIEALNNLAKTFAPPAPSGKKAPGKQLSTRAPSSGGRGWNRKLDQGKVRELQTRLGFQGNQVDGKYGQITHRALQNYLDKMGFKTSIPGNYNQMENQDLDGVLVVVKQKVGGDDRQSPADPKLTPTEVAGITIKPWSGDSDSAEEQTGQKKDPRAELADYLKRMNELYEWQITDGAFTNLQNFKNYYVREMMGHGKLDGDPEDYTGKALQKVLGELREIGAFIRKNRELFQYEPVFNGKLIPDFEFVKRYIDGLARTLRASLGRR